MCEIVARDPYATEVEQRPMELEYLCNARVNVPVRQTRTCGKWHELHILTVAWCMRHAQICVSHA